MSHYLKSTDFNQKKNFLKQAVETVVSSRIYTEIDNIKTNNTLTFDTPGYVLYKTSQIPNEFDWQFIACENGQNIKDGSRMLENIITDKHFDDFSRNLSGIISQSANPSKSAALCIANYAINVATHIARQNHDNLIGISNTSLNRKEDYIYGGGKRDRISDLTNNMFIDYSIFGYDE
jgi:hypothetical protein